MGKMTTYNGKTSGFCGLKEKTVKSKDGKTSKILQGYIETQDGLLQITVTNRSSKSNAKPEILKWARVKVLEKKETASVGRW